VFICYWERYCALSKQRGTPAVSQLLDREATEEVDEVPCVLPGNHGAQYDDALWPVSSR
jgi:hypothetical protein